MENRTRKTQLKIYLTEEEKKIFKEKMKKAKCRNMSHFLRGCVFEKEIYYVDLEPFRKIQEQLWRVSNNINQIAKRVNSTGVIYKNDIEHMKKEIDRIAVENLKIYNLLVERIKSLSKTANS